MSDSQQNNLLKSFFKTTWKVNSFDQSLIDEINGLHPENVLDVGCGYNLYKAYIPNLIGLDIVNSEADVVCDILDFNSTTPFDVIMCLGSLNFGGEEAIQRRLQHVVSLLNSDGRIYMRVNPGIRWAEEPDLEIFPWDKYKILSIAAKCGLKLLGDIREYETPRGIRLRFTYIAV